MDMEARWENLRISNDFMFGKVMQDKRLCIRLLEQLLNIRIDDIRYLEEQKTIDLALGARGVRLDVYVDDGKRIFNVEMQTSSQRDLPQRSRYYQDLIDLNSLEKGEYFGDLKESYVIFICTFDPFGIGLPRYSFENICREQPDLQLQDQTHKIFFNTTAYERADTSDIQAFLKYVNDGTPSNVFTEELEDTIQRAKTNEEWRLEYMKLYTFEQDARRQGLEEGMKRGMQDGLERGRQQERQETIAGIISALKNQGMSVAAIRNTLISIYAISPSEADGYIFKN